MTKGSAEALAIAFLFFGFLGGFWCGKAQEQFAHPQLPPWAFHDDKGQVILPVDPHEPTNPLNK